MTILLLEDNPHDVRVFTAAMQNRASITIATNGAEALDRVFRRGRFKTAPVPDIVVLDLNTPLLNGHEVLNVLKANSETCQLPAIIWSVSEHPRDIAKAFELGACAYMVKSINVLETESQLNAFADFWLKCVRYPATSLTLL